VCIFCVRSTNNEPNIYLSPASCVTKGERFGFECDRGSAGRERAETFLTPRSQKTDNQFSFELADAQSLTIFLP